MYVMVIRLFQCLLLKQINMQPKIKTIKRPNGFYVAFEASKKFLAQAKKKRDAILLYTLGQFNIKD